LKLAAYSVVAVTMGERGLKRASGGEKGEREAMAASLFKLRETPRGGKRNEKE